MKLTEKQKIVVAVLVFLALLGGVGTLVWFKNTEREKALTELSNHEKEEALARKKIEKIPELHEQRAQLAELIDRYAEILPPEEHAEHAAFVNIIDNYRRDTQILIQKAEYVPLGKKAKGVTKQQSFVRHKYRFKLIGSVPDFLEFVSKIENHKRFMKVDSFNIIPLGAEERMNRSLGDRDDTADLERAMNPVKEIDLFVSTYTYVKGLENSKKS